MPKRNARKRSQARKPIIHVPAEMHKLLGSDFTQDLRRRIDRREGCCGICGKVLGRKQDLAMVGQLQDGDVLGIGDWLISTTHRACKQEGLNSAGQLQFVPKPTYRSLLMALPVQLPDTAEFARVPVMCVNPGVDHFSVTVTQHGSAYDRFEKFLTEKSGFARMEEDLAGLEDDYSGDLVAYVRGADVSVSSSDAGIAWTHENSSLDDYQRSSVAADLERLLKEWGALLVLVSPKFKMSDPQMLMERLPELIVNGDVLGGLARPEFQTDVGDLMRKAEKEGPFDHARTDSESEDVSVPRRTPAMPHRERDVHHD